MSERVGALDGIRGVAILMVLYHHAIGFVRTAPVSGTEKLLDRVATEAWSGVDLFFVLSGYLITTILLRTRGSSGYFKNFIVRRALRIFPLYYLFLVVLFVILPRLVPQDPELAKLPALQAWYWSYLPNVKIFLTGDWNALYVEHAWSLAIEEQFYLIWPLVVALCSRRALLTVCAVCAPASLALRIFLVSQGGERASVQVLMPAHLDGLMLGSALAALTPALVTDVSRARRVFLAVGGVGLGTLLAVPIIPLSYELKHYAFSVSSWSLLFVAFVGWSMRASPRSLLVRALSSRPLRTIGKYSYGLYLVHQPLMRVLAQELERVPAPALFKWAIMGTLGGGASLALAALVYELFEVRFLELKRWFEPRPAEALRAGPAPGTTPAIVATPGTVTPGLAAASGVREREAVFGAADPSEGPADPPARTAAGG